MFENRQLALFEGKCRRFRNSSECLNTHCAVAQITDQFGRKRYQKKRIDVSYQPLRKEKKYRKCKDLPLLSLLKE